jgi:peptide/nickel transport system permease protein
VIYVAAIAAFLSTFNRRELWHAGRLCRRSVDGTIMAITDIILTIPVFPLLAVLAAFITLDSLTFWACYSVAELAGAACARCDHRRSRSRSAISSRRRVHSIMGTRHIVFRELVPNMMTYIVISFTLALTSAVYTQVGLVFLGLVPISTSNWGVMISLAWTRVRSSYTDSDLVHHDRRLSRLRSSSFL